ncbi:DUF6090 family protein [uncultured Eudoraea sp.]|uniref:DUF6090 family protein n=1 Tax=uncultured Eudoraea sp. TaxID=1035614 RepID=UPI002620571A|nr:DUF6090 family protein [uncultured Eudoraea sp.]
MINFFRKIRRKLADDNKPLKYLRYAVGEIVLVVVGILIALQVNNWNEDYKESQAIKSVLYEIKEDLIKDKAELERNIEIRTEDFEAQKRIINVLESKEIFNENVHSDLGRIHLARNVFSASKGYDLLKELNLGTLKDKELRVLLTQYYERDIAWVHREFADDKLEFENFWLPYVRIHFKDFEFGNYAIPHDYSQILNDPTLLTATKMNINNLNNTINAYKSALSTAIKLMDKLPD